MDPTNADSQSNYITLQHGASSTFRLSESRVGAQSPDLQSGRESGRSHASSSLKQDVVEKSERSQSESHLLPSLSSQNRATEITSYNGVALRHDIRDTPDPPISTPDSYDDAADLMGTLVVTTSYYLPVST